MEVFFFAIFKVFLESQFFASNKIVWLTMALGCPPTHAHTDRQGCNDWITIHCTGVTWRVTFVSP